MPQSGCTASPASHCLPAAAPRYSMHHSTPTKPEKQVSLTSNIPVCTSKPTSQLRICKRPSLQGDWHGQTEPHRHSRTHYMTTILKQYLGLATLFAQLDPCLLASDQNRPLLSPPSPTHSPTCQRSLDAAALQPTYHLKLRPYFSPNGCCFTRNNFIHSSPGSV